MILFKDFFKDLGAVVQRCSVKEVFLEISQNSQQSSCARACFLIKLQASGLQLYIKKETLIQLFSSEFSEISKNTVLCRTPLVAGSEDLAALRDSLLFGHWENTYLAENLFITASVFSYFVTVNTAQLLK